MKKLSILCIISLLFVWPANACFTSAQFDTLIQNAKNIYEQERPIIQDGFNTTHTGDNVLSSIKRDQIQTSIFPAHYYEIKAKVTGTILQIEEFVVKSTYRQGINTAGRWSMFLDYLKMSEEAKHVGGVDTLSLFCEDCSFVITHDNVANGYLIDLIDPLLNQDVQSIDVLPGTDLYKDITKPYPHPETAKLRGHNGTQTLGFLDLLSKKMNILISIKKIEIRGSTRKFDLIFHLEQA